MWKKFGLLLFLLIVSIPLSSGLAQDNDPGLCSPDTIRARIETIYDNYVDSGGGGTSSGATIIHARDLRDAIDAVYAECDAVVETQAITLLETLHEGGLLIYVRHTHTDRSRGDTDLSSCDTQRILSERGRDEARAIRPDYEALAVPISRLISTEYCRTRETAEFAFGEPEIIPREQLANELSTFLSTPIDAGTNIIIVAHIGTLDGATDIDLGDNGAGIFEEGDALIFRPLGDGQWELVGRIALGDWAYLAEVSQRMAENP